MENSKFYEKSLDANRNLIAISMIVLTLAAITLIAIIFLKNNGQSAEASDKVFNALLPLFATWIGTVLAFYFGKENFEAASSKYQDIINKLSPEILDDVNVNQIMITKKTMVSKNYDDIKDGKVVDLITFLTSVDKSRLPILKGVEIKYIVHKSLLLDAKEKTSNDLSFQEFEKTNSDILKSFISVDETAILEDVRNQMKMSPNVQDVFVVDTQKQVVGWLTNTLIMDYLKTK